ncbi:MAG: HK97 family phage prohead protease [Gammaproteobacteria bacterium]|nr:HK97 family phage prohead protease [Gammaproteobacteria bacterium]
MEIKVSKKLTSIKAVGDADGKFAGNLSTYGNIDEVNDIMEAGAFDDAIKHNGTKYPLLYQHDSFSPIGSFEIVGTEDALEIEGRFNLETQKGREAYALLKAEDVTGLSIGFWPIDYFYDDNGLRHLKEVELIEGSFVTFPANKLAVAEAKSMSDKRKNAMKLAHIKAIKDDAERTKAIDEVLKFADEEDDEDDKEDLTEDEDPEDEELTEDDKAEIEATLGKYKDTVQALKDLIDELTGDEDDKGKKDKPEA